MMTGAGMTDDGRKMTINGSWMAVDERYLTNND